MTFENEIKTLFALTKPRITFLCVIMTLGGMLLSSKSLHFILVIATLLGTTLSVSAANAANMYIERHSDKFMKRTRHRPLPMGKISPKKALIFSIIIGTLSIPILYYGANALTAFLSFTAMILYAFIYTPLKKITPHALEIGAVPGAIPPLLGWTAIENRIDGPGMLLFLLLFIWQIPHFIAISDRYYKDYNLAGIKTIVESYGLQRARLIANIYILLLISIPCISLVLGYQTQILAFFTFFVGALFLFFSLISIQKPKLNWGKNVFWSSIFYLPIATCFFVAERFIPR